MSNKFFAFICCWPGVVFLAYFYMFFPPSVFVDSCKFMLFLYAVMAPLIIGVILKDSKLGGKK